MRAALISSIVPHTKKHLNLQSILNELIFAEGKNLQAFESIQAVRHTIIHMLSLSVGQEENVFWISAVKSANNHNVQDFYMETSQLPSSTMPVICPTVNQAVRQAHLLSCLTCGVRHKERSSLYTL